MSYDTSISSSGVTGLMEWRWPWHSRRRNLIRKDIVIEVEILCGVAVQEHRFAAGGDLHNLLGLEAGKAAAGGIIEDVAFDDDRSEVREARGVAHALRVFAPVNTQIATVVDACHE